MARPTLRRRVYRTLKDITNWLDTKVNMPTIHSTGDLGSGVLGLSSRRLSVDTFFTVYRSHGDVYAVVRELAENTGMEGYKWVNVNNPEKEPDTNEVEAVEKILNRNKTFRRFKSELIQTVMVTGNSYVHIEKGSGTQKPIGVNFVDPRTISVVTDKYGNVLRWVQKVKGKTQDFKADEIAHLYTQRDPNSPVFGLSPMEPIFWEIRTDQSAMVSNYIFFENDAVPAAQYILDEDLSDKEQKRAIEQLREQIKGADKRHKSVAIKGIKDIKQLSVSAKDMEFHVLRRFTTEKVCAAYGVPKSILNYTEAVNRSTAEEQTKKFWQGTILPLEETLAEFINTDLLPKLGIKNIKIEFNPKTFENQQWNEASTRADQAQGLLTINEVREARGYEPFDATKEGEWVDRPILLNGTGAVPLEDVGIDPLGVEPAENVDAAVKEIARIRETAERYDYGRKTDA